MLSSPSHKTKQSLIVTFKKLQKQNKTKKTREKNRAPSDLTELLISYVPGGNLRSSDMAPLDVHCILCVLYF